MKGPGVFTASNQTIMYHYRKSLSFLLLAGLISLIFLPSCSEMQAGNKPETQASIVPEWLDRTPGVGTLEERNHIFEIYSNTAAALNKNSKDIESRLKMGEIFINEARVTGEHPYYYPAALKMLNGILEECNPTQDQKFQALSMIASVQLSLHQFREALATGEQTLALNPYNAFIYGVMVDANVELGNYEKAVEMSDKMVSIRPDLRSYSRISYLREIHGEVEGAMEAMEMAVAAGFPGYEETAWCRTTLGKLYENYGQLDLAAAQYQQTLIERENFPFALAGLASVEVKKGNLEKANELLDQACKLIPEVSFYGQKAHILQLEGKEEEARQMGQKMQEMMAEDAAAGHNMALEMSRVYLELQGNTPKALENALQEYHLRPDNIEVNAQLAAIYYTMKDYQGAENYLKVALKTHSQNPEWMCLNGLVRYQLGDKVAGRELMKKSLEMNPYLNGQFADEARELI